MILVDSSVWIDYFRGISTPESEQFDAFMVASFGRFETTFFHSHLRCNARLATQKNCARRRAIRSAAQSYLHNPKIVSSAEHFFAGLPGATEDVFGFFARHARISLVVGG